MTAVAPAGASQIRLSTFVDTCALRSYPGAMELGNSPIHWRRNRRALRSSSRHPSLRLWLRPSLRSSLHGSISSQGLDHRSRRGLRAWRLADISTHSPGRNIKSNRGAPIVLAISLVTPLALGVVAIASALAPQRFAGSTAPIALGATAIASALARHRLVASALASQRFGFERRRAWRLA